MVAVDNQAKFSKKKIRRARDTLANRNLPKIRDQGMMMTQDRRKFNFKFNWKNNYLCRNGGYANVSSKFEKAES